MDKFKFNRIVAKTNINELNALSELCQKVRQNPTPGKMNQARIKLIGFIRKTNLEFEEFEYISEAYFNFNIPSSGFKTPFQAWSMAGRK